MFNNISSFLNYNNSTTANMLSETKSLAVAKESQPHRLSPIVITQRHRKFSATFNILSPSQILAKEICIIDCLSVYLLKTLQLPCIGVYSIKLHVMCYDEHLRGYIVCHNNDKHTSYYYIYYTLQSTTQF